MKNTVEMITIPKAEYDKLTSGYAELSTKAEWLMEQFRLAQRRRFGASSEKSADGESEQLNLFNEAEISSDILVPEPELIEIEKAFTQAQKHG